MGAQMFNTFWHGGELSPLHWACIDSFVKQGHELRVFSYEEPKLPPGTTLENARQIVDEAELFEFERSFSAFSNIFRYRLLLEHGGWWVDTDVYCRTREIPDCTYSWAEQSPGSINGAVLRFPSDDATLESILEEALIIGKNLETWGELGPRLLTKHLGGRTFADHYGSTSAFYPVHWLEAHRFWLPEGNESIQSRCAQSPFIHLWGSMFSRYGIDIDQAPPRGSFLEWMLEHSGFHRALPPPGRETEDRALKAIHAFLERDWVQQKCRELGFAEEMS